MAENLKVVHYRDGSAIPNVTSNLTWGSLTTGAWCDYSNLTTNEAIYGHFYNGYAAVDSRNIAPNGWHVPSDAEWTQLTNFLGGTAIAGAKLKETGLNHWLIPNTGATNETGFSGLANGSRRNTGEFDDLGKYANFYTSTMAAGSNLYYRALYYNDPLINIKTYNENYGFAIRCIKD